MKKPIVLIILITILIVPALTLAGDTTLIMYYTRSGKNKIIAEEVKATIPAADIVEIQSDVGIMKAVFWHQLFNRVAEIDPIDIDVTKYNQIIMCSPIWLQKLSSPARAVINTLPLEGKKMVLFVTCAGYFGESGQQNLKELVASKGIDLDSMHVLKVAKMTEEEIRKEIRKQLGGNEE